MAGTWYKVDNVAKVFLASNSHRDPRVFRVSCTLNEPIDPAALDLALARTVRELPDFQVTLHRGLFWHYLESTNKRPVATPEDKPPCAPIYGADLKNELLYRVSYYESRINVEMFHALCDGNGGMLFLRVLVHNYLLQRHPAEMAGVPRQEGSSAADRAQDSFQKFYGRKKSASKGNKKIYRIHGLRLPYQQSQFFEAHLSTRAVLAQAHALGVSLTSYLSAVLLRAIYSEMSALERGRPVVIDMPVNLRNYYPSDTIRNFFNSVQVAHTFTGQETLGEIAKDFDAKLKEVLSAESVQARMDGFEKLEQMPGLKPIPLFLKNYFVAFFNWLGSRNMTATISNMGRIQVPQGVRSYINSFSSFCSSEKLFTVVCSYGDDLVLGTTSPYRSTNVMKEFYRSLAEAGLEVTLYATEVVNL